MSEYPHTVESVARVLGRFEMHLSPLGQRITLPYGVETLDALGFAHARSLNAFVGEFSVGPRPETLAKFGVRRGRYWVLEAPNPANRASWVRLLKTDTPMVIESPSDCDWVSGLIHRLWRPIIYHTGSSALSEGAVAFCRRYLSKSEGLLIATSPQTDSITLFGRGQLFERALEASALKSPDVWGYSDAQRADILRGALRLFKSRLV